VLTFAGICWWETRHLSWHERPWYSAFPPATALLAFAAGAAGLVVWVRR
jgi:hypothetical protein